MQLDTTILIVAIILATFVYTFPYIHIRLFRKSLCADYRECLCRTKIYSRIVENEHIMYKSKHSFSDWHGLVLFWVIAVFTIYGLCVLKFNIVMIVVFIAVAIVSSYTFRLYLNYYYSYIVITDKRLYWYSVEDMLRVHIVDLHSVEKLFVRMTKNGLLVYAIISGKKRFGVREFSDAKDLYSALGKNMPEPDFFQWK